MQQVSEPTIEYESKLSKMEKRLEKLEKDMAAKEIGYLKRITELQEKYASVMIDDPPKYGKEE